MGPEHLSRSISKSDRAYIEMQELGGEDFNPKERVHPAAMRLGAKRDREIFRQRGQRRFNRTLTYINIMIGF
jgi:hypothetical protein